MASEKAGNQGEEKAPCDEESQESTHGSEAARRAAAASRLTTALAERGFAIVDSFITRPQVAALRERCLELAQEGALHPARIGRGANERRAADVRGDFIAWLEQPARAAEQGLLDDLEYLRGVMNRELMAGLIDFEGHFARYPAGASYARHIDRAKGTDVRAISAVLYLNDAWSSEDGGELRIHTGEGKFVDLLPEGGRLVAFLSERFEHEVLPAMRERLSFTGWFRRRPLDEIA
jgi:SM-20-related protein